MGREERSPREKFVCRRCQPIGQVPSIDRPQIGSPNQAKNASCPLDPTTPSSCEPSAFLSSVSLQSSRPYPNPYVRPYPQLLCPALSPTPSSGHRQLLTLALPQLLIPALSQILIPALPQLLSQDLRPQVAPQDLPFVLNVRLDSLNVVFKVAQDSLNVDKFTAPGTPGEEIGLTDSSRNSPFWGCHGEQVSPGGSFDLHECRTSVTLPFEVEPDVAAGPKMPSP